jgi:hypothetical protein
VKQTSLTLGTAIIGMAALLVACGDDGMVAGPMTAAGAGGGAAGMSAAGAAAPVDPLLSCADVAAMAMADAATLHAGAAAVLLPTATSPNGKCSFSSCHNPGAKKGGLVLDATVTDLNAVLVGKTSCEAPNLPLVDGSKGDAALAKSWVWLKLVAPVDSAGEIKPQDSFGAPGACGQMNPAGYGLRMPQSSADSLPAMVLAPVKAWICGGAPSP